MKYNIFFAYTYVFVIETGDPSSWTLRIASQVYESDGITLITHPSLTLTQLISSMHCYIQHENDIIKWEKSMATVNTDGFEVS